MEVAVSFLVDNLKQLVVNQADLITGADVTELRMLEEELQWMKEKLKIESLKQVKKGEAFKEWEKQMRMVVYKVEDTIDAYMFTHMDVAKKMSRRMTLAKQIKKLRKGPVKEVLDSGKLRFASLTINDVSQESDEQEIVQWRRLKEPKKSHIVGLEDEAKTIINYLMKYSNEHEVISIIGMPGLGKTTLAWKIFEDPDIQCKFSTRIWVTVSPTLNRKDMFLTILKKYNQSEDLISMSDDELVLMVRKMLGRGQFLIIFDDLWTMEAWNQIKEVLPMDNGVGKVLITTCIRDVASNAMTTHPPYVMRLLNDEESWELLQSEVFDEVEAVDADLANIGRLIANNCSGLPLMIVVIAKILSDKIATATGEGSNRLLRKEWEKVCVSLEDHLIHGDQEERVLKTIALSYSQLPFDLRDCFLYLGMFPKGALIPVWQLIRLWVAEGFIQPKPDYSFEEIALDNLKDLISRSLVMVHETKRDGEVKACRVHEAIRLFCKYEGALEKENLFQEIRMNKEGVFEPELKNIREYRRLSIHSHVPHLFLKDPAIPTRSFLCFPNDPISFGSTDIAKAFSLLRVFAAEKIEFSKFPSKMAQLIHLRYLTLSVLDTEFKVLPDPIFKLWNLQTLVVETLSSTLQIKADIWKMMQLRHFKTKTPVTVSCTNGTGRGCNNLQTFGRLSPESCTNAFRTKANNLNALAICGDLSKLLLQSNGLEKLDKLKLEHDASTNQLGSLPHYDRFPRNLKHLTLTGMYLNWVEMSTVGKLDQLEVIKLKKKAFMGESWDVDYNGFQNLKFLYIEDADLASWKISDHSFPRLTGLTLKDCQALKEVPHILGETLEMLSLECVTPTCISSARKIEELANGKSLEGQGRFKLVLSD